MTHKCPHGKDIPADANEVFHCTQCNPHSPWPHVPDPRKKAVLREAIALILQTNQDEENDAGLRQLFKTYLTLNRN